MVSGGLVFWRLRLWRQELCGLREHVVEEVELDLVGEVAVVHLRVSLASLASQDKALALRALEALVELVGLDVEAALAFSRDVEDGEGDLVFQAPQVELPEVVEVVAHRAVQHPEAFAYVAKEQAGYRRGLSGERVEVGPVRVGLAGVEADQAH